MENKKPGVQHEVVIRVSDIVNMILDTDFLHEVADSNDI
jgi:hypothetical protein